MHDAKYWTNLSRDGWGSGPWDDEPDKVQWTDSKSSLPCLAVRHPELGHWCGYVGVPASHPLHGVHYGDDENMPHLEAHGGVNFSAPCEPAEDPGHGVCHVPEPGQPDDIWWFGFDCAHMNDVSPGLEAQMLEVDRRMAEKHGDLGPKLSFSDAFGRHYKSLNYVRVMCTDLAEQLHEYGQAAHGGG